MRTIVFRNHPLVIPRTNFSSNLSGVIATCLLSLALFGCAAAYNARTDRAPDDRHAVRCYIRGALGRSYYRENRKRVVVSIYSRGPNDTRLLQEDMERQRSSGVYVTHPIPGLETKLIFEKRYSIKGSDVSWDSAWEPDNSLSIAFYDHGQNVAADESSKQRVSERILLKLQFNLDPKTSNYVEAEASAVK